MTYCSTQRALTQRRSKEMRFDRRARLIGDRKRNQEVVHLRLGVSAFPERWSGVKWNLAKSSRSTPRGWRYPSLTDTDRPISSSKG